jgi:hypothetical protein
LNSEVSGAYGYERCQRTDTGKQTGVDHENHLWQAFQQLPHYQFSNTTDDLVDSSISLLEAALRAVEEENHGSSDDDIGDCCHIVDGERQRLNFR